MKDVKNTDLVGEKVNFDLGNLNKDFGVGFNVEQMEEIRYGLEEGS